MAAGLSFRITLIPARPTRRKQDNDSPPTPLGDPCPILVYEHEVRSVEGALGQGTVATTVTARVRGAVGAGWRQSAPTGAEPPNDATFSALVSV